MKILYVASEARPFVKTGGLGDVMGALPKTVASMKNDCRVGEDRAKDAALLYKDFNANRDVVLLFEPSDELFTIISESMLDKAE